MTDGNSSADSLELPERSRLARLVEFGWPSFGAASNFLIAATGAVSYTNPIPSMFWLLVTVYFGSGMGGQNIVIRPGMLTINNIVKSTVVRNAIVQRAVSPGPGVVVLVLKGHDDIMLRWSPLGARYWKSKGRHMPDEILRVYGNAKLAENTPPTFERRWIRWRIIYWASIAILSPVPFLLGLYVAYLLSGGNAA